MSLPSALPLDLSWSMNCSVVSPLAWGMRSPIFRVMMPPKMTSVARPRIFGPMTFIVTAMAAMATTMLNTPR